MLRKVIRIAGKTHVVSLPSAWLRKFSVNKGDDLLVEEKDAFLIVSPGEEIRKGKVHFDVSGATRAINRMLGAAYKAGYEEVDVTFESEDERRAIEHTIEHSVRTFAIVEKTGNTIRIKNVSRVNAEEFDALLRRLFLLLLSSAKEIRTGAQTNDKELLAEVQARDREVNAHADYCRRILNTQGHTTYAKTPAAYVIAEQLEKIGDLLRDIARDAAGAGRCSNESLAMLGAFEAALREFYELHYRFDAKKLAAWLEKVSRMRVQRPTKETQGAKELSTAIELLYGLSGALIICAISGQSPAGKAASW